MFVRKKGRIKDLIPCAVVGEKEEGGVGYLVG